MRTKVISHSELNEFLFKELSYGYHKDVLLYKFNNNSVYEEEILEILEEKFNTPDLNYNQIDRIVFKEGISSREKLAAVKVITDEDTGEVERINLIFVKFVQYTTIENKIDYGKKIKKEEVHRENSYFPVEINFKTKEMIVKSAPKARINKSEYKGVKISENIAGNIINYFNLEVISYQFQYQKALYNMCKTLLEDVIKEKCKYEISVFDDIIYNQTKEIESTFNSLDINVNELKKQIKAKNVFDINIQISNMIENIVISKILIEAMKNKDGLEGIISYIKFKDRTSVDTVLKTDKRKNTLLDTQVYLDLRKTIQQSKLAERIRIVWFNNNEEIQLAYDTKKLMYIHIHFYEKLFEGDLRYAINRINDFNY
ncbi:hypothetical protein [Clostridium intestinale]|uniref:hypothetical protein n=1 Tax=Clostridium intestinale TaxID=36845 RepID=UPI0028E693BF|nr:hypothetical protein [Clostridium intestinale]